MVLKRTSHAVYDTKYHLVWSPKYRKWILRGDIRERVHQLFHEIAENHDIEIDTLEIAEDHVHLFVESTPDLSPEKIQGQIKQYSNSAILEKFPSVRDKIDRDSGIWDEAYFVETVSE